MFYILNIIISLLETLYRGMGMGANHQTGWTALVAQMINIVYKQDGTVIDHGKNRKYDRFRPKNRYVQKSPSLQVFKDYIYIYEQNK